MVVMETILNNLSMKLITYILLFAFSISGIYAQSLKIGDNAPPIEAYKWLKGERITQFEKGQVYVVEMGATWCKPCAAAIPELSRLAKKYEGKAQVVSLFVQEINYEPKNVPNPKYVDKVITYVKKQGKKMQYNIAVDDPEKRIERSWIDAMGRGRGVPQTFIIDKEGKIAAHFSGFNGKKVDNTIESILNDSFSMKPQTVLKQEKKPFKGAYNRFEPLYVNNNGGNGSDFTFRSILSKYKGDILKIPPQASYLRSWHSVNRDSSSSAYERYHVLQGRFQTVATPLSLLYYIAYSDTLPNVVERRHPITNEYPNYDSLPEFKGSYGEYWHEPVLEVADKEAFETSRRSPDNKWNYVLNVPNKKKATALYLRRLMREDLQRYFPYEVTVETRKMPCWFLKAGLKADRLKTKTPGKKYRFQDVKGESTGFVREYKNADIRDIIFQLAVEFNKGYHFSRRNPLDAPFIDKTEIDYLIDYDMTQEELEYFDDHDLEKVQKVMERLGLYLEKGSKPMKVIVIRDPKS